jgi:hypothetical protein
LKKPARFLRVFGAMAIMVGLLAATMVPAVAQEDDGDTIGVPGFDMLFQNVDPATLAGDNTIYFPWVANDDDFGLGPADTSISVQNLEDRDSQIWIYTGNGDGTWSLATTAHLSRYASKTFTAAQLGLASGEGAPVAVTAFHLIAGETLPGVPAGGFVAETPIILSNPLDGSEGQAQVLACVVNAYTSDGSLGSPYPFIWTLDVAEVDPEMVDGITTETDEDGNVWVTWSNQDQLQALLDLANEGATQLVNPFGGLNADGDCFDVVDGGTSSILDSVAIGGVAKQEAEATATGGDDDEANGEDEGAEVQQIATTATAVSGYNALNGAEVYRFDQWYLPIVQTNCGPGGCWDSVLRVGNVSGQNAAVTIRFFPADDGSGSLQTGFQIEALVNGGDTWHVSLSDYVPEGWVGSAHIYTDGQVFAMVDRFKVGYNMWVTNSGSSADFENIAQIEGQQGDYVLFAPHVLLDYFGWNTGINVANLYEGDNNVSIQYFNMLGNSTQVLNQRLAAHGMTYFYDPSVGGQNVSDQDVATDANANVVGSALIWSDYPVAAAIDATKYPETDPNGGVDVFQATSYSATQNVFEWQAVPLIQKGNPTDGSGATSGINMMNPNSQAVTANVYFVNPSGFNAQNFGTSSVTIPGFANGFVYSLWQHNLPNGFQGAAQVVATLPIVAVSANVNYDVDGDGSALFNAFNPCGLYRVVAGCEFGGPLEPTDGTVIKTFVDQNGDPVEGVQFQITTVDGAEEPYTRDGISGEDGSETFENVPLGDYELYVLSVPDGYAPIDPSEPQETFTVDGIEPVELTNTLELLDGGTVTGIVNVTVLDDSEGVEGIPVVLYNGTCAALVEDIENEVVESEGFFDGAAETDVDGLVTFEDVAAGDVCAVADADEDGNIVVGTDIGVQGTAVEGEVVEITISLTDDNTDELGSILVTTTVVQEVPTIVVDVAAFAGECSTIDTTDPTTIDSAVFQGAVDEVTGQVAIADLEPGTYCVFADFDGDAGFTFQPLDTLVGVEAVVTAGAETPAAIDLPVVP